MLTQKQGNLAMTRRPDSFYFKSNHNEDLKYERTTDPQTAIKIALDAFGVVSPAYLQRKCKISYSRAVDEIARY